MKIAVCLSGLIRSFDVTSKLFKHWNTLYDDVEFYFFISTWKGIEDSFSRTRGNLKDWDFSKYKFVTKYEKVDIKNAISSGSKGAKPSAYYSYSLYRVQKMRREYEEEFDGVIQTRSDIFIDNKMLDGVVRLCKKGPKRPLSKQIFYTTEGLKNETNRYPGRFMLKNDYFGFAHPIVMDIYSLMYHEAHIAKLIPTTFHYMNGEYLMKRNIYVCRIDGVTKVFPQSLSTNPNPQFTSDAMKFLIKEYGVEWLYTEDVYRVIYEVIKTL